LTIEEALAGKLCTELISGNHRISEATFNAALQHFGAQGLVEVVLTLGYFAMIALPLNAFEIEMTPEQQGLRKPYAPLIIRENTGVDDTAKTRPLPPLSDARTGSARLPLLQGHDDVAPEHQHFVDRIVRTRGCISPVFQILLHAPDVAERVAHVGDFFLFHSVLPRSLKALTWLIAAREIDCDYAWAASVPAAHAAGLDTGTIAEIGHGEPLTRLTAEQKILFDFCYPLLRGNHHVSDAAYETAIQQFGVAVSVQIAGMLGYVLLMGWIANAFEISIADNTSEPAL
jgi:4-carboxymuconolactone decarboxylase